MVLFDFFFFLGGGMGGPEAPLMFYIYAIICGGFLIGGCVSFSCCVMGVGRAERFIFGSTWFLPVYGQYSREANFCDSLQLVTELLLITLMLLYLWLLQLLVTLFLNNRWTTIYLQCLFSLVVTLLFWEFLVFGE